MDPDPAADASAVSVHDAVLTVIPASLLLALVVAVSFPLSVVTAVAFGSLPATGTIGYALFYNPPDGVAGQ